MVTCVQVTALHAVLVVYNAVVIIITCVHPYAYAYAASLRPYARRLSAA